MPDCKTTDHNINSYKKVAKTYDTVSLMPILRVPSLVSIIISDPHLLHIIPHFCAKFVTPVSSISRKKS